VQERAATTIKRLMAEDADYDDDARYSLSIIQRDESWWVEVWDTQSNQQAEKLTRKFPTKEKALAYADGLPDATIDYVDE